MALMRIAGEGAVVRASSTVLQDMGSFFKVSMQLYNNFIEESDIIDMRTSSTGLDGCDSLLFYMKDQSQLQHGIECNCTDIEGYKV